MHGHLNVKHGSAVLTRISLQQTEGVISVWNAQRKSHKGSVNTGSRYAKTLTHQDSQFVPAT